MLERIPWHNDPDFETDLLARYRPGGERQHYELPVEALLWRDRLPGAEGLRVQCSQELCGDELERIPVFKPDRAHEPYRTRSPWRNLR